MMEGESEYEKDKMETEIENKRVITREKEIVRGPA